MEGLDGEERRSPSDMDGTDVSQSWAVGYPADSDYLGIHGLPGTGPHQGYSDVSISRSAATD